jgi:lysophospholipase L1-like esterase
MSQVFPVNSTGISLSGIQRVNDPFVGRKAMKLATYVFGSSVTSQTRVNFRITAVTSQTFTFNAYYQGGSNGDTLFKLSIDGGAETNIVCVTADSWQTYTVDLGSTGAHNVQLRSPAADNTISGIALDYDSFITAGTGSTLDWHTGYGKVYGVTYPTSVSTTGVDPVWLGETDTSTFIHLRGQWKFDNSPQRVAEIRAVGNFTDFKIQPETADGSSFKFAVLEDGILLGYTTVALTSGIFASLKGSLTFAASGTHDYRFIWVHFPTDAYRVKFVMAVGGSGIVTSALTELSTWDFYGDSISAADPDGSVGHPFKMAVAYNVHCRNLGVPFARAKHTAGDTSNVSGESGTARITAAYPLSVRVIILFGTNDLLNRSTDGATGAADETRTEFQAAYLNMLQLIAAGVPAMNFSCGGVLPNSSATEPQRLLWNQAVIDAQAPAIAGGIPAGQFTTVANVGDLSLPGDYVDGVTHPNGSGYDKIVADYAAVLITTPAAVSNFSMPMACMFAGFGFGFDGDE